MNNSTRSEDLRLEELGSRLAREGMNRAKAEGVARAAEARLGKQHEPSPRSVPWRPLAAVAAAALVSGFLAHQLREESPLTGELDGSPIAVDEWFETDAEGEAALTFSDGTTMLLHQSGRARVEGLHVEGAEVAIGHGSLTVSVHHTHRANWTVKAGPFTVEVTGTRFEVSWEPNQQHFTLRLVEGRVILRGPGIAEDRTLIAGQSFDSDSEGLARLEDGAPNDAIDNPLADDSGGGGNRRNSRGSAGPSPSPTRGAARGPTELAAIRHGR